MYNYYMSGRLFQAVLVHAATLIAALIGGPSIVIVKE